MASSEPLIMEEGIQPSDKPHRSSSSPPIKSSKLGFPNNLLANFRVILLGSKISVLFIAIPFAIFAHYRQIGSPWIFGLSLLGLAPLAERLSFLTEKIAFYTGPTIGGLLNATCGNVTEMIIAILALWQNKVDVVKYSLLGSILSNLLLVLGTSLFCGGIANLSKEQNFDRRNADSNSLLLLLGLVCHALPLLYKIAGGSSEVIESGTLQLSRASAIIMLIVYVVHLFFQLCTHGQYSEDQEIEGEDGNGSDYVEDEAPVIGFWSAIIWLIVMTAIIALLSDYIVATIEEASDTWGLPISFISVILLPISGNAAEHASAIIFAFKNKLDIALSVAIGSATQISMFVIPICVIFSWMIGVRMDLALNLVETSVLGLSILLTAFTLQDGKSHYIKGLVLVMCYFVIGTGFFLFTQPLMSASFRE